MKNKVTRKSFLWILFFGILVISVYSSCTHHSEPQEVMFKVIYKNNVLRYKVVYDVETNVEYVVSTGRSNRGTFTMLVDSTGKPKLHKH